MTESFEPGGDLFRLIWLAKSGTLDDLLLKFPSLRDIADGLAFTRGHESPDDKDWLDAARTTIDVLRREYPC